MKMDAKSKKTISKNLSYVLRHRPDSIGIVLEAAGWVNVEELLAAFARDGRPLSRELLDQIVAESDKQRFELSPDGARIRARQGHSVEVDLGYEPAQPPNVLYHGTAARFLESIWQQGLIKGRRHHVHMSTDQQTMRAVAMRKGKPVLLAIDARRMSAGGHQFFVTGNRVWLTDHVPAEYLKEA
jgi:putative RNA 2'-phosphotransferase